MKKKLTIISAALLLFCQTVFSNDKLESAETYEKLFANLAATLPPDPKSPNVPLYMIEFAWRLGLTPDIEMVRTITKKEAVALLVNLCKAQGLEKTYEAAKNAKDSFTKNTHYYFLVRESNDDIFIEKQYTLWKDYIKLSLHLKRENGKFIDASLEETVIPGNIW